MSILHNSDNGWLVCHKTYIDELYTNVGNKSFSLKSDIFNIHCTYKSSKSKAKPESGDPEKKSLLTMSSDASNFTEEVELVRSLYSLFKEEILPMLEKHTGKNDENEEAVNASNFIYSKSGQELVSNSSGYNNGPPVFKKLSAGNFLIPANSRFFSCDVLQLANYLGDNKYDVILLDPPWWNKYIRRKRKHSEHGYDMMFNFDLKSLPLEKYLKEDGLIVVWCTNSNQNIKSLLNEILPKWGVAFAGKWYWLKITRSGTPVCGFSKPPGKQPFEQIIFGCKETKQAKPPPNKLVVSVPSALHSHKPPLTKLLEPFLPENPAKLELFARYLLPEWTSYGNEVLKLQHESLYEET